MAYFKQTRDYEILEHMHKKAFPDLGWTRDFKTDVCWLIKNEGHKIVGFTSLSRFDKDTVFFSRTGIFENGCGFHRDAIHHRVNWCKRHGIKYAITYAHFENYQSIANLIRTGFQLYEPEEKYAGKMFHYFIREFQYG